MKPRNECDEPNVSYIANIQSREEEDFGCDFPNECMMTVPHLRSECHTVEMFQQFEEEMRQGRMDIEIAKPHDGAREGI